MLSENEVGKLQWHINNASYSAQPFTIKEINFPLESFTP